MKFAETFEQVANELRINPHTVVKNVKKFIGDDEIAFIEKVNETMRGKAVLFTTESGRKITAFVEFVEVNAMMVRRRFHRRAKVECFERKGN